MQIQQRAVQSQRALTISKQQIAAKERERRILQLTIEEIKSLDEDVNLYKGVGKMCAGIASRRQKLSLITFVQVHAGTTPYDGEESERRGEGNYGRYQQPDEEGQ